MFLLHAWPKVHQTWHVDSTGSSITNETFQMSLYVDPLIKTDMPISKKSGQASASTQVPEGAKFDCVHFRP
jgi:hypothetical protein